MILIVHSGGLVQAFRPKAGGERIVPAGFSIFCLCSFNLAVTSEIQARRSHSKFRLVRC